MLPAGASATIKNSKGLTIGSYKPPTFRDKVMAINYPPTTFNSKWTFQMDCGSGFVSAASIPILNKELLDPLVSQLYGNLITDISTTTQLPTMANLGANSEQYSMMLHSYVTKLRLYNSSTNTLRGRIVWYKPVNDMDGQYETAGTHTNSPINQLMLASNSALPVNAGFTPQGLQFDTITAGANYQADYHHAGAPVTGALTTTSSTANVVAQLDTTLVPGSVFVRRAYSKLWSTLKTEEFMLEPGNQFNTSLSIKGKMINNLYDDADMIYRKNCSIVGVIYVLGQVVFSDVAGNSTITTGSSQLSVMREDTCLAQPRIVKRNTRMNMTNPYQTLATTAQAIINDETGMMSDVYAQDL